MALNVGSKLGPYEITALLGKGGMGEVYRARDSKLKRDIAIKILPDEFSAEPEWISRFQREAEVLASLNHQNIASIYDLQQIGESRFLILELVEGETLAEMIRRRGAIPLDDALHIGKEICEAIEAAHEKGILHRDLKPSNVKVDRDGKVKVLDFGLAKAFDTHSVTENLSNSPTLSIAATSAGVILGTASYMSPEQARGRSMDRRTDIWAFGCILYEMLTGKQAFHGEDVTEILASIVKTEPNWQALPPGIPTNIRTLLFRCLQKDVKKRIRDAGDIAIELEHALSAPSAANATLDAAPRGTATLLTRSFLIPLTVLIVGGLIAVVAVWRLKPSLPAPREVRFDITTPDVGGPHFLSSVALSPDGQQILFVADSDGQPYVWLREMNSVAARPLAGTGGGAFPFWSPDGRSIAFYADGLLKRLDLDGGLVRSLTRAIVPVGGTWNRDGVILFARNPASVILRLPAEGGPEAEVTRLGAGQIGHTFPHFLPDGRHFLYYVTGAPDSRGIHVGQLDGSSSRRLVEADGGGVYTNGYVLFIRQSNVFAQEFDVERLELKGSPFQVAEGVFGRQGGQFLTLSASAGAFAFRAGEARFGRQFVWVDRSGKPITTVGERLGDPDGVSWSPDRTQLVYFERGATTNANLWMLDTRRGVVSPFTNDTDENIFPLWARDGNQIIYSAVRNGQLSLYQKHIATGQKELLIQTQSEETFASDTSPDGRYIFYQRMNPKTGWDIWALPRGPNAAPIPVIQTDADEHSARLSPDGKWIAFVSNTSGVSEIYVQPFPRPGPRMKISTKGGDEPQWRADGAELFYLALDGRLTATSIKPAADHQSIDVGPPVPLFPAQVGLVVRPILAGSYIASVDGQRFLVNRLLRDAGGTPVRVVLNWRAGQ